MNALLINYNSEVVAFREIEEHRDIQGARGKYTITSFGRVFSRTSNRFLKLRIHKGYYEIKIPLEGKPKGRRVVIHQLVCKHFLLNPLNKPYINHKDCNKLNNRLSNLEWCTPQENAEHAVLNGRLAKNLSKEQVDSIRVLNYQGIPIKTIAHCIGTSYANVYVIINGLSRMRY